jgi:hypothetical protein
MPTVVRFLQMASETCWRWIYKHCHSTTSGLGHFSTWDSEIWKSNYREWGNKANEKNDQSWRKKNWPEHFQKWWNNLQALKESYYD